MSKPESQRLAFIEQRDGLQAAKAWAKRTMRIYRTAVLKNGKDGSDPHYASGKNYRRKFIESYLHLKRYVYE